MYSSFRPAGLFLAAAVLLLLPCAPLCAQTGSGTRALSVSGKTLSAQLTASNEPELRIKDRPAGRTLNIRQLFTLTLQDGSTLEPSGLQWRHPFAVENSPPLPAAGKQVCADLSDRRSSAQFHWCLIVPASGGYMREQLTIRAQKQDLPIAQVRLLKFDDPRARVVGTVKGSPVADGSMFFGFEHPLSWSRTSNGVVEAGITRELALRAGQSVTYSAVIGSYPPGQLRRAFLAYIEDSRPRPYRPFLNYNTWYDIGYQNRYSESSALDRIHAFGTQLVKDRHVHLDSFVFDDGWDNPSSFWGFNKDLPDGFTRVAQAAEVYRAGIGVWLSPWGGYGAQKQQRVAYGRTHGYEIVNGGLALSGPKYFQGFSNVCFDMMERYHVNLFKFDGAGNADRVFPGSAFDSDFDAAIHLIHQIRVKEPGIFINLTTGTYPSPFWLFYADSIWRGGDDHSFAGVGTERQRWITYRDEQTYRNIVLRGPLFPLNSLMLHGIIYARHAQGLATDPKGDFSDEVLSFFGGGTQLQEMYVTPSLLTAENWDILARAAKWSRAHAAILEDTHWIGGDPGKLQVYGWAAWNPKGWILTLRNPADRPQSFPLHLGKALELPAHSGKVFTVEQPFTAPGAAPQHWQPHRTTPIRLEPFEVRIFESGPA